MSITSFAPSMVGVGGHVYVGIGAGFASLTAPKLSEISINITAAINGGLTGPTDVKMKEIQYYNQTTGQEMVDTRTRKLSKLTLFVDGAANQTALDALLAEDHSIGIFIRPFTASATALAVGDKGDPYNATIASLVRGGADISDKWTIEVEFAEVTRGALMTALVA